MKKIILIVLLSISFTCFTFGNSQKTVTVKNNTGYEIYYLYITPSSYDDWDNNLLEDDTIKDGEELTLNLKEYNNKECIYDIQAIDEDDDSYSQYEKNICSDSYIEITVDDYDDDNDDEYNSYEEGYNEGYMEGQNQGYKEGFKEGYREGFRDGKETDNSN